MMRMKRTMLAAVAALPLAAFAQAPQAPRGQAPAEGQGQRGMGPGGPGMRDPERMEKRMRLALTLGLAEALDLDQASALKLGDSLGKLGERRLAIHQQMRGSHDVLRRAATGEKVSAAEVDQAIQKALDARAELQTLDRETVKTVTQGLTPEKKARAVLFLARFHHRFGGMGPGMHMRGGPGGGMGPGMMRGRQGNGAAAKPGELEYGLAPGAGPGGAPWDEDD
jgi:hypothetical protein